MSVCHNQTNHAALPGVLETFPPRQLRQKAQRNLSQHVHFWLQDDNELIISTFQAAKVSMFLSWVHLKCMFGSCSGTTHSALAPSSPLH